MGFCRQAGDHAEKARNVRSMTDYASLLFDSVARLRKAATTEAVCREMVEFSARLGFDRVIVCSLFPRPDEDELIDELFFVHGDWAEGAAPSSATPIFCTVRSPGTSSNWTSRSSGRRAPRRIPSA